MDPILTALIHTARAFAGEIPAGCHGDRPVTANQLRRLPGKATTPIARRWRTAAAEIWAQAAAEQGVTVLPRRCVVVVTPCYVGRNYAPDVGAQHPTLKWVMDGLRSPAPEEAAAGAVGAGLIPDDTPGWIDGIVWRPAQTGLMHGLLITIHEGGWLAIEGPPGLPDIEDDDDPDIEDDDDPDIEDDDDPGIEDDDDPDIEDVLTDAEQWRSVRDIALDATDRAWNWLMYHAHVNSVRGAAKLTGIARPSMIRWMGGGNTTDESSRALNPADNLRRMLSPEAYKEMVDGTGQGRILSAAVRNGGPWPMMLSVVPHTASIAVHQGRWFWVCACGQRSPRCDTEHEAEGLYIGHTEDPEPEHEPF